MKSLKNILTLNLNINIKNANKENHNTEWKEGRGVGSRSENLKGGGFEKIQKEHTGNCQKET